MKVDNWEGHIRHLKTLLAKLSFRNEDKKELPPNEGFLLLRDLAVKLRNQNHTLFIIGNGASASMASHFATDFSKTAHIRAQVFSDPSLITAVSNDLGYEKVFAEPLSHNGRRGDMLVAISSSGKSPNILAASRTARSLDMTVVTLSSMHAGNPLRSLGTLNVYVSAGRYGPSETCHAAILHYWVDLVEQFYGQRTSKHSRT